MFLIVQTFKISSFYLSLHGMQMLKLIYCVPLIIIFPKQCICKECNAKSFCVCVKYLKMYSSDIQPFICISNMTERRQTHIKA